MSFGKISFKATTHAIRAVTRMNNMRSQQALISKQPCGLLTKKICSLSDTNLSLSSSVTSSSSQTSSTLNLSERVSLSPTKFLLRQRSNTFSSSMSNFNKTAKIRVRSYSEPAHSSTINPTLLASVMTTDPFGQISSSTNNNATPTKSLSSAAVMITDPFALLSSPNTYEITTKVLEVVTPENNGSKPQAEDHFDIDSNKTKVRIEEIKSKLTRPQQVLYRSPKTLCQLLETEIAQITLKQSQQSSYFERSVLQQKINIFKAKLNIYQKSAKNHFDIDSNNTKVQIEKIKSKLTIPRQVLYRSPKALCQLLEEEIAQMNSEIAQINSKTSQQSSFFKRSVLQQKVNIFEAKLKIYQESIQRTQTK